MYYIRKVLTDNCCCVLKLPTVCSQVYQVHEMLQQSDVYSSISAEKTDSSGKARSHVSRTANPNAKFRLNLENVCPLLNIGSTKNNSYRCSHSIVTLIWNECSLVSELNLLLSLYSNMVLWQLWGMVVTWLIAFLLNISFQ